MIPFPWRYMIPGCVLGAGSFIGMGLLLGADQAWLQVLSGSGALVGMWIAGQVYLAHRRRKSKGRTWHRRDDGWYVGS